MSEAIPKQLCPFCGYAMDRTDGLEIEKPKVGDISKMRLAQAAAPAKGDK